MPTKKQPNPAHFSTGNPIDPQVFNLQIEHLTESITYLQNLKLEARLVALEEYRNAHTKEHEKKISTILIVLGWFVAAMIAFWGMMHYIFQPHIDYINEKLNPVYDRVNDMSQNPTKKYPAIKIQKSNQ